jgi:2-dehydropantoate 2-reductase
MRFHFLGLGPVASLIVHHLRHAIPHQHSITLIHHSLKKAVAFAKQGSSITLENGGVVLSASGFDVEVFSSEQLLTRRRLIHTPPSTSSQLETYAQNRDHEKFRPSDTIDSLFVTGRTVQTVPSIRRLLPRISANTTIVLLQRGLGVYEDLVQEFFPEPSQRPQFILAASTHSAWLKRTYNVVHTRSGQLSFGIVPDPMGRGYEPVSLGGATSSLSLDNITQGPEDPLFARYRSLRSTIAVLFSLHGLCPQWTTISKMQTVLRRQLVVDTIINSLTMLMGCHNGDLFHVTSATYIARGVCQEAAAAFSAQMLSETQEWLDEQRLDKEAQAQQIPLGRLPNPLRPLPLLEEVQRVAQNTKGHISPMLTDVWKGKRIEIRHLHGYLLGLGERYQVPMPVTRTLFNLVKMRVAKPLDHMF